MPDQKLQARPPKTSQSITSNSKHSVVCAAHEMEVDDERQQFKQIAFWVRFILQVWAQVWLAKLRQSVSSQIRQVKSLLVWLLVRILSPGTDLAQ